MINYGVGRDMLRYSRNLVISSEGDFAANRYIRELTRCVYDTVKSLLSWTKSTEVTRYKRFERYGRLRQATVD